MRTGITYIGVACLVLGIGMFAAGWMGSAQAFAAFGSCVNNPQPFPGMPTACTNAMSSMALWGAVVDMGAIVGILGLVLLILGLLLQPEVNQPPWPYAYPYTPPANAPYNAPPAPPAPQEPRSPPPGTP